MITNYILLLKNDNIYFKFDQIIFHNVVAPLNWQKLVTTIFLIK
jgi:hypothetical protein